MFSIRRFALLFVTIAVLASCSADPRKTLLEQNISFDAESFVKVAGDGNLDAVKLFLKAGMAVDDVNSWNRTALFTASANGQLDVVRYLIKMGAFVDARDQKGRTAAIEAARAGHIEVLGELIDAGSFVDLADTQYRLTPLIFAAFEGKLETVRFLISKGGDVNARNKDGGTAIMNASFNGHADVVRLLIDSGADVNLQLTGEGYAAVHFAAEQGHVAILELLANAGAKLDVATAEGDTPESVAKANNRTDAVAWINSRQAGS